MIARACEWNPSVFRKSGEKDDIFNVSETICMSSIKITKEYPCH